MTVVSENEFRYRQSTHTSMVNSLPGEALTGSVLSVPVSFSFHKVLPQDELLNPQSPPETLADARYFSLFSPLSIVLPCSCSSNQTRQTQPSLCGQER